MVGMTLADGGGAVNLTQSAWRRWEMGHPPRRLAASITVRVHVSLQPGGVYRYLHDRRTNQYETYPVQTRCVEPDHDRTAC